ncbi:hypothetical protein, unlikely [Trypanosoma congolense IL3000]|uniref:Uncharacterized protein n=1 Tax=Trypanosoma congolense (strain IL3000) TaxID=1068625 RepID=F9W5V4_TRYCI|nr:hypothetical protein, unlikely [Trypanosoma congolense IL3000]
MKREGGSLSMRGTLPAPELNALFFLLLFITFPHRSFVSPHERGRERGEGVGGSNEKWANAPLCNITSTTEICSVTRGASMDSEKEETPLQPLPPPPPPANNQKSTLSKSLIHHFYTRSNK